jgi:hypothetical protein
MSNTEASERMLNLPRHTGIRATKSIERRKRGKIKLIPKKKALTQVSATVNMQ